MMVAGSIIVWTVFNAVWKIKIHKYAIVYGSMEQRAIAMHQRFNRRIFEGI